jgi:hypothetical protein
MKPKKKKGQATSAKGDINANEGGARSTSTGELLSSSCGEEQLYQGADTSSNPEEGASKTLVKNSNTLSTIKASAPSGIKTQVYSNPSNSSGKQQSSNKQSFNQSYQHQQSPYK